MLHAAAFLDSREARAQAGLPREGLRKLAEALAACCYEDLAKAPQHLEGEDMRELLGLRLPARLAKRDPLAAPAPAVIAAWLDWLEQHAVVPHIFELRRELAEHGDAFLRAVESGSALAQAPHEKRAPFVHQVERTGRNAPCPCGSGKKLKHCCGRAGA
jgi:hypothetical protein